MKTYKRLPPEIDTNLNNYNKYFNQMNFKGILEDENIYAIDQESFRDAKNVYVDWNNRLVSRPTLQVDEAPKVGYEDAFEAWEPGQILLDIKRFGSNTVYTILAAAALVVKVVPDDSSKITLANYARLMLLVPINTKYHIVSIDHYIICFNDTAGAQVFDTNQFNDMTLGQSLSGWKPIENFVDIPVVKRVIGNVISYPNGINEFTNKTKEQYVWTDEVQAILPDGNAEVVLHSNGASTNLNLPNTNINTPYRLLRELPLRTEYDDIVSAAKGRLCIATDNYFLFSPNNGKTYERIYYPSYNGQFLNIASISDDGLYFFFVASDGVYRCNLGDYTWANVIKAYNSEDEIEDIANTEMITPYTNYCKFLTGDIFMFVIRGMYRYYNSDSSTTTIPEMRLYYYGPTTPSETSKKLKYINKIGYTDLMSLVGLDETRGENTKYFGILVEEINARTVVTMIATLPATGTMTWADRQYKAIYISGQSELKIAITNLDNSYKRIRQIKINSLSNWTGNTSINHGVEIETLVTDSNYNATITKIQLGITAENNLLTTSTTAYTLKPGYHNQYAWNEPIYEIEGGFIQIIQSNRYNVYTYSYESDTWQIDTYNFTDPPIVAITDGNIFYLVQPGFNNTKLPIISNALLPGDTVDITYTVSDSTRPEEYKKIPKVSYSGTELYLGFDNLLQITANIKDGTDTYFNLPSINNQSFIDNITGMINISTTEIALFFLHKIIVCSKVVDETYGYRYDYYNTKLSTGIRLGDSIINTLEGSYTIFPTRRGLAIMNYQAFMATTDQVIQYMTDNVKDMWLEFFDASEEIHIIQHRDILVFTNNTQTILMYNLTQASWWKWEIPVKALIALTDQDSLRLINEQLLIFKKSAQYFDLYEKGGNKLAINWYVLSQPLHMKAPNYYKNLKQLIFQLSDSDNTKLPKSMLAQIKLFRKKITLRDPETIMFKIEELRTFVKRFNYWKINEVQWGLSNDDSTATPAPLELNGIGIKYEIGEEVR